MKNLKIAPGVHNHLKVFAAKNNDSMTDIGGLAIMEYLNRNGHKFTKPKQSSKPSKRIKP